MLDIAYDLANAPTITPSLVICGNSWSKRTGERDVYLIHTASSSSNSGLFVNICISCSSQSTGSVYTVVYHKWKWTISITDLVIVGLISITVKDIGFKKGGDLLWKDTSNTIMGTEWKHSDKTRNVPQPETLSWDVIIWQAMEFSRAVNNANMEKLATFWRYRYSSSEADVSNDEKIHSSRNSDGFA